MNDLNHEGTEKFASLLAALPPEIISKFREEEKKEGMEGESPELIAAWAELKRAQLDPDSEKAAQELAHLMPRFEHNARSLILLPLLYKHNLFGFPKRKAFEVEADQSRFEQALAAWLKTTD